MHCEPLSDGVTGMLRGLIGPSNLPSEFSAGPNGLPSHASGGFLQRCLSNNTMSLEVMEYTFALPAPLKVRLTAF